MTRTGIQILTMCFILLVSAWAPLPAQPTLQEQIFSARDKVLPALVHVEPVINIYTQGEKQHAVVTGSGVIFSPEGYVITNHHVASNAEKVWCTLYNKQRITAEVVGSDQSTDIAVLKLNLSELSDPGIPFAELGNSDSLEVGQIVLALGSPLGLSRSVSMGVVSSIDRYFPDQGNMISPFNLWIQTDAAINPGNSGGPLINLRGEVMGINARAVFFAENLGFAIPINLVKEVAEEIIQGRSVRRTWIGVEFQQIKDLKEYLKQPDLQGVLIAHVDQKSPAAKAGLRPGDVLQKIGDQPVHADFEEDLPTVRKIIAGLAPGQTIPFTIWRDGKQKTLKVHTVLEPFGDEPEFVAEAWGMVIKNLNWHIYNIQSLSDFKGVYITSVKPGGPAERSNLRSGDVLRTINGKMIVNSTDFQAIYAALQKTPEKPVYLEMIRNGHPYFAVLKRFPRL